MFYISVNFDFCIMKKLWDLAHEKLETIMQATVLHSRKEILIAPE